MLGSGLGQDSVGTQNGRNLTLGAVGAHGASGTFGAQGLLRAAPLATNCWPEAPKGGGGGLVGVLGPVESPPSPLPCKQAALKCNEEV